MTDRLADLSAAGVSIWLDDISRERLITGGLDALRRNQHVVGVTSNPTIFAKALAESEDYADQVRDLALRGVSVEEAARMITTRDVRWACDVMRPAYDASSGVDGRVSIEVDPRLAYSTEKTVAEARQLAWLVDRDNAYIKIPATGEGVPAIAATLAEGISVNVTLIFGLGRYEQVIDAFMTGLEKAKANGHDLAKLVSVASFFVSRVDTEVDKRLDRIGTPEALALRGKAANANAQLAYQVYEKSLDTDRWRALAAAGARPQRPLWASTSTKNPDYSPTLYVDTLIGRDTVNTLAQASIDALAAGEGDLRPDTVLEDVADAQATIAGLAEAGVDFDDVTATLEREGVESFIASFEDAIATLAKKSRELAH